MYYGVDYYPEHWPRERWDIDARLMREAGFNVVRMAEFAWARLEPSRGEYAFGWLDEAIAVLARHGIKTVLGTPTATPPKWLCDRHPSIYPIDEYGHVRGFGSRRHYCFHNPAYREHSRRIAAIMADHYRQNPNVIAWQIDNEFGCHDNGPCFCEHCRQAFIDWLKRRYGTINALNAAWGTVFWSQTYGDWDEVILPALTYCQDSDARLHGHNPGLLLDHKRFVSDSVVSYQREQLEALRKLDNRPITHNFMGHFSQLNYYDLARELSFVCWDNYPGAAWGAEGAPGVSMAHDIMRGLKKQNFWMMEQKSGPCGWSVMSETPPPGRLRVWAWQAVAHGADAMVYFRWRACRVGAEQYWFGVLDHDGVPRRRYHELARTGREMQALEARLAGSRGRARVALVKCYVNEWSHAFMPQGPGFSYPGLLYAYYAALAARHYAVDIVSPDDDFAGYDMLVAPAFNVVSAAQQQAFERYVAQGGTLVVTFKSGARGVDNAMREDTLPGAFRAVCGVTVEEVDALSSGTVTVRGSFGEAQASVWCDCLAPVSAQPLAEYASRHYAGYPAVTVNEFGQGRAYYVGCDLPERALGELLGNALELLGVEPAVPEADAGVEAVWREKDGLQTLILINHNDEPANVKLPGPMMELTEEKVAESESVLPARAVWVLAAGNAESGKAESENRNKEE